MRNIPVLLAVLLACLLCAPAMAHQTSYEADANHDGLILVFKDPNSHFHNGWNAYRQKANHQLNRHTDEPLLRVTHNKSKAEVYLHQDKGNGCFGYTHLYVGSYTRDDVELSAACPNGLEMKRALSHEFGHVYGFPAGAPPDGHHPCTDYWQTRSVNVGDSPGDGITGCPVKFVGFGPHDIEVLAHRG